MPGARYQIPQHPTLGGPHTKDELYLLVERGSLGRGEIVTDRATGRSHVVGDLIRGMRAPRITEQNVRIERPAYQEFSGDTPWDLPGQPGVNDEEDVEADDEPTRQEEGEDMPGAVYDEETGQTYLFQGHPSWLSFTKWILLALLLLGMGVVGMTVDWRWLAAGALGFSITLCTVIIARQHRDYTITTNRIEHQWGLFGRSSKEVRIQDVRSIDVDASGLLGMLGIGNVNVSSAGSSDVEVQFKNVRRAHKIKELIRQLQTRSAE
jgi:membrane protein YdbS with pleckstrin-like domain